MYIRYNNTRNECNQVYRYLYKKKISLLKLRVVVYSILGGVGMYMAMYTLVDYIYKIFFINPERAFKDITEKEQFLNEIKLKIEIWQKRNLFKLRFLFCVFEIV